MEEMMVLQATLPVAILLAIFFSIARVMVYSVSHKEQNNTPVFWYFLFVYVILYVVGFFGYFNVVELAGSIFTNEFVFLFMYLGCLAFIEVVISYFLMFNHTPVKKYVYFIIASYGSMGLVLYIIATMFLGIRFF